MRGKYDAPVPPLGGAGAFVVSRPDGKTAAGLPSPAMTDHTPLSGRQAIRVGLATTCMHMVEVLMSGVPTADDRNLAPGDWLDFARKIASMRVELLHRCITAELANGTSWADIAAGLGISEDSARHQFGHCDLNHLESGQDVWDYLAETCVNPVPGTCAPTPEGAARELDDRVRAWQRHPGEHARPAGRPVSDHL